MVKNRINFFWLTKSTNCIFFQSLRRVKIYSMKNFYSAKNTLIDNKLKANSSSCAWAIKICQHLRRVIYHEQQNSMQFLNICKKWWFFFVWAKNSRKISFQQLNFPFIHSFIRCLTIYFCKIVGISTRQLFTKICKVKKLMEKF